jgi:hypothetical protein
MENIDAKYLEDCLDAESTIKESFPGVALEWGNDGCPIGIAIPSDFPMSNYDVANGVANILRYFGWSVKLNADDL